MRKTNKINVKRVPIFFIHMIYVFGCMCVTSREPPLKGSSRANCVCIIQNKNDKKSYPCGGSCRDMKTQTKRRSLSTFCSPGCHYSWSPRRPHLQICPRPLGYRDGGVRAFWNASFPPSFASVREGRYRPESIYSCEWWEEGT